MDPASLWAFLPIGYVLTVLLESPWLWWGLSREHDRRTRLLACVFLTAVTYPIVVLVLPPALDAERHYALYLAVAETFAPAAEIALFRLFFPLAVRLPIRDQFRDAGAIVAANLCSFLVGGALVAWSKSGAA